MKYKVDLEAAWGWGRKEAVSTYSLSTSVHCQRCSVGWWVLPVLSWLLWKDMADGSYSPFKKEIEEQVLLFYTCSPLAEDETTIKFQTFTPYWWHQATCTPFCYLNSYTICEDYLQKAKSMCVYVPMTEREREREREWNQASKHL